LLLCPESSSELLLPADLDFTEVAGDFDLTEGAPSDLLDLLEVTDEAEESLPEPDFDFSLPELLSESDPLSFSDPEPESSAPH